MHVQGRLHAFHNHSSTCEAAHPIRHIPGPVRRAGRSMADRPWVGHRRVVSTDVWTFRVSSGVLDSGACIDVMSPLFLFRIKQYNRYVLYDGPMWRRADHGAGAGRWYRYAVYRTIGLLCTCMMTSSRSTRLNPAAVRCKWRPSGEGWIAHLSRGPPQAQRDTT